MIQALNFKQLTDNILNCTAKFKNNTIIIILFMSSTKSPTSQEYFEYFFTDIISILLSEKLTQHNSGSFANN